MIKNANHDSVKIAAVTSYAPPPPPRFSAWLSTLAIVALLVAVGVVSVGETDFADAQSNTNNVPEFGQSSYSFELEVGSNGTVNAVEVGTVTASDADSGDSLTLCAVGSGDTLYVLDEKSGRDLHSG